MTTGVRNTVIICVAVVFLIMGLTMYNTTREPVLSDEELRDMGVYVLPTPRDIGAFELTDHHGNSFTNADLEGQWNFVFFGFTYCPDICPVTMSVLSQVEHRLRQIGDDALLSGFQGLLITVDPERDDLATLGTYVEAFSDNFLGVRGELPELAEVARQLNVAFARVPNPDAQPDDDSYLVDHSGNIVIINPRGHYHGFIRMPHDVETVELAYRSLQRRF